MPAKRVKLISTLICAFCASISNAWNAQAAMSSSFTNIKSEREISTMISSGVPRGKTTMLNAHTMAMKTIPDPSVIKSPLPQYSGNALWSRATFLTNKFPVPIPTNGDMIAVKAVAATNPPY
jgi:CDP-diacylglycerol pyrophosphatase